MCSSTVSHRPTRGQAKRSGESIDRRRQSIVNAAFEEFTRKGFAAARMDDIAARARVAKGTLYLYFHSKQALFQAIIQQELSPVIEAAAGTIEPDESVRDFLERTVMQFVARPRLQRRAAVVRLLVGEAGRFPKLAETYFRSVVQPAMTVFRRLGERALRRGELTNRAAVQFPHLMAAPVVLMFLWTEMFNRFEPLDGEAMLRAHFDQLFQPGKPRRKRSG
jgi:AcrR family transcriptional regulator